jgi:hypothetical protein
MDVCLLVVSFVFVLLFVLPYVTSTTLDDRIISGCLGISLLFALAPAVLLARLYVGEIRVDDDGIAWWVWKRRWRSIRWRDATILLTKRTTNYATGRMMTSYCISTAETLTWWNLMRHGQRFDDTLPESNALNELVAKYSSLHKIRILTVT